MNTVMYNHHCDPTISNNVSEYKTGSEGSMIGQSCPRLSGRNECWLDLLLEEVGRVDPGLWNEIVFGLDATCFLCLWMPLGMSGGLSYSVVQR